MAKKRKGSTKSQAQLDNLKKRWSTGKGEGAGSEAAAVVHETAVVPVLDDSAVPARHGLREQPRVARNADMLRANIEKCEHATTEALFAEAPGLCDYIWEGWEGIEHYQRSPLSLAVSYNDTWLVRFLITKTNCDAIFAEDWFAFPMNFIHANSRGDVHPYGSKHAPNYRYNQTVMDQALSLGYPLVMRRCITYY